MINKVFKTLTIVANYTAIGILEAQYGSLPQDFTTWGTSLRKQLSDCMIENDYQASITQIDENYLRLFENRLFGRLVTAGILIYMKTTYISVRQILRHFTFDTQNNADQEDSALRYLRIAFFLAKLPNGSPPETEQARRRVLEGLSQFEQARLRSWWTNYTEHVLFERGVLTDLHISYLKKIMNINF